MALDVTVLRVFTDENGDHGNPLGVVDARHAQPADRQRIATELGYSETIFITLPEPGSSAATAHIFTPAVELPFAGHPTVGASWWLQDRGTPINTLKVPAGIVRVAYEPEGFTVVSARADWAPDFAIHDLGSIEEVLGAHPDEYASDVEHYPWAWIDESAGTVRSRMFAARLGVAEDEATGSAAVRLTEHLGRDLTITQGKGSQIRTRWSPDGWVTVAGRVVDDGVRQLS